MALDALQFLGFLMEGLAFVVETLFGIFFRCTGEILLYVVTLGKRKPQWNVLEPFTSLTAWLGFAVWAGAFAGLVWIWAR